MASNVSHLARVMTETQMQGGRGAGRTRAQTISLMTDVVLLNQLGDALTQRVRSLSTQGRGPAAPSRTGFQRPRERSMIHEKFSKIPWTDLPEEDRKQITQRSTTSSEQGITSDKDPRYWNFNSFKSPVCLCCGSTFHIVGYCPTLFVRTRKGREKIKAERCALISARGKWSESSTIHQLCEDEGYSAPSMDLPVLYQFALGYDDQDPLDYTICSVCELFEEWFTEDGEWADATGVRDGFNLLWVGPD